MIFFIFLGCWGNVFIRMAWLGTSDVLCCIDISSFWRFNIESTYFTSNANTTSNIITSILIKFFPNIFKFIIIIIVVIFIIMCSTSDIKFNPNNPLFSVTDCIIILSTFSFFSFSSFNEQSDLLSRLHSKFRLDIFHLMCLYMCTWISVLICTSVCLLWWLLCLCNKTKFANALFSVLYLMVLFGFIILCSRLEMRLKITSIFLSSYFISFFFLHLLYTCDQKQKYKLLNLLFKF